jgi:hypothetical protein
MPRHSLHIDTKRSWRCCINTQNYCVLGLCPSSGIRRHNVSETESVSVLRWGGGDTYSVGSLRVFTSINLTFHQYQYE